MGDGKRISLVGIGDVDGMAVDHDGRWIINGNVSGGNRFVFHKL